ncbi:Kef-type K+ transport system membrane component KefB [Parabacteroides sp. PFB2-12]|uniref:cation:proton antiporter n=1 Tax=unclassified Parabacteroides TaxID=2649774 RepID=UPI002476AA28|nr:MULTISPECIES: cation:proton antiporter [unclassified Parabacteroides]MDH6343970.1 Kef-type K+ transport system membrane component KefB [Parabacteroides sp. PM6-13]MDH6391669.1 Kef-type K+ transport system membrane component KefB [Parabacteroides sp. PFB2-12]
MSKGTKGLTFYLVMIIVFGSLMYFIAVKGESQQMDDLMIFNENTPTTLTDGFAVFRHIILEHIQSDFGLLLLQIIVILLTCRLFGWLFKKIGQPTVIGEILAGIILGPSILGHWFPEINGFLFPEESLANITLLSQFGLILFMYAIGMELDLDEVRKKLKETILISHTSTVVPFFLGMLTAYFVYDKYADPGTPFLSFALFIGIAMSITAFPVLARIIQERGLTKTHLGTISLASAANGDITAWCLLAVVISIAQAGSMLSAVYNIFFSGVYMAVMFFVVRPFLRMIGQIYHNKEVIDKGLVAFMFLILLASSYLTEILGLHALFGAFMAGVIMPSNIKFRKIMTEKVEDVSLSLFLPLFFASSGLRTQIGLLNTPALWGMCLVFILVAIVGKFGGATISARVVGESWKNSLYIGALMNTRGLMELIILTIGLDMGILSPTIFVMLVLMTLVTTFMTTPLISFIKFCFRTHDKFVEQKRLEHLAGIFRVLISFGRASNGQVMLDVAHQMFSKGENKLDVTALHLTIGPDVNPLHTDNFEEVSFGPILYGAKKLNMQIETRYEISNNASQDICNIVNQEGYDFLLVGAGITWSDLPDDIAATEYREKQGRYLRRLKAESWFFPGALLKDKTKYFIEGAYCPVGVFVNRNFVKATEVIVIIDRLEDLFLFDYALTLLKSTHGQAVVLDRTTAATPGRELIDQKIQSFVSEKNNTKLLSEKDITEDLLDNYNFMLVSYETWNLISENRKEALQTMPSTLILNQK